MYKYEEFVEQKDLEPYLEVAKLIENDEQLNELLGTLAAAGAGAAALPWAVNKAYNWWNRNKPGFQPQSLGQRVGSMATSAAQGVGNFARGVGNIGRNVRLGYNQLAGKVDPNDPQFDKKLQAFQMGMVPVGPNDPNFAAELDKVVKSPDFAHKADQSQAGQMNPTQQQQFWQQKQQAYGAQTAANQARADYLGSNTGQLFKALEPLVNAAKMTKANKTQLLDSLRKALKVSL